ncbi:PRC-barrel domain-containing protein [Salinarimonas chemoclinalis]|uniref:PRC-barrel domain-containing protein n=1 Tax=Salinarimonas chemoclinalis TaxID=3241599 RepID=UPI003556A8E3
MTHHITKTAPNAGALAALLLLLAAPASAQGNLGNPPDRPPAVDSAGARSGSSQALRILGDDVRLPPGAADGRVLTITDLDGAPLHAPSGEVIGRVDKIVLGPDRERWVVFDHGGTLGLDERTVALPIARVTRRGDDFYVHGVTEEDMRNLPGVDRRWDEYSRIEVEGPLGIDARD